MSHYYLYKCPQSAGASLRDNVRSAMPDKRLYAKVNGELHRMVKAQATNDGKDLTDWVYDAILEKLNRTGHKVEQFGPYSGLKAEDRKAADAFIELLHTRPQPFKQTMRDVLKALARLP